MMIKEYYQPKDLADAYDKWMQDSHNALMGGGAWMKLSSGNISTLISLDKLNLDQITEKEDFYSIGAKVTLRELEIHPLTTHLANGILHQAIQSIMGVPLRNVATIGGTIVGRYGFSDLLTALLALDTNLTFFRQGDMSLRDFLHLKKPEKDILLSIQIRKQEAKGYFKKIAKTALDFAILNLAITKTEDQFKIVVGSRPAIATFAIQAMDYLSNLDYLSADKIAIASEIAMKELDFSSNQRATKEYRAELAKVYVRRGLKAVTDYEG